MDIETATLINLTPGLQAPNAPKVSIGMPVYNGEAFIREALDSLLMQTYADYELIISDNASTDGTEAICREYVVKDARISYVRQAKNRGYAANFQFLLDEALGEYFMWMAADDILSDEYYLDHLIKKMEYNVDYVFPDVSIIDSAGKILQSNLMHPFDSAKTRFDFAKASTSINSYQVYGVFRTEQLKEDFGYLERHKDFPCFGEGLFVHVICTERSGVYVPDACKYYRRHGTNFSSIMPAKLLISPFWNYSISSIIYFIFSANLSTSEKFKIVIIKIFLDSRYLIYLLLAAFAQKYPMIKVYREKLRGMSSSKRMLK
jgi:glycosyltransferase involved in cell wall biosynthesis